MPQSLGFSDEHNGACHMGEKTALLVNRKPSKHEDLSLISRDYEKNSHTWHFITVIPALRMQRQVGPCVRGQAA